LISSWEDAFVLDIRGKTGSYVRSRLVSLTMAVALLSGLLGAIVLSGAEQVSAASSLHYLYGSGSQTGGRSITLRVELTENAPAGGARVTLSSSSPAVQTPSSVTVSAGQKTREFSVKSNPVVTDTSVTVSATYQGLTRSRVVLIKAPVLSSIGVQTKIRAGGVGKVIVRLSGPAPAGGVAVNLSSDPVGALIFTNPAIVPAGSYRLALVVPAMESDVDVRATVTATSGGRTVSKSTIIRNYDPVVPTPTPTATATEHPNPLDLTFELWNGPGPFLTGLTSQRGAVFRVCVFPPVGMAGTIDVQATNGAQHDQTVGIVWPVLSVPTYWCTFVRVQMANPGETNLALTVNVAGYPPKFFTSNNVTFVAAPTATPSSTATNTPVPTTTATNTPEPTATATNTVAPLPAINGSFSVTLENAQPSYAVGDVAQFRVCYFGNGATPEIALSITATNGTVSPTSGTIAALPRFGFMCSATYYELTGNAGAASITVTASVPGYQPVTIPSESVEFAAAR
jgi:hypothetical protein